MHASIKIELLAGEPMRHVLPVPEAGAVKVLQGKESVALDLGTPEGIEVVRRLARRADVVLLGYRAGVAERLGVDGASLRRENPRLVCLAAPGYGIDGPCGRKPAFAPTIGVASGAALFQAGPSIPHGPELTLEQIKPASIRLNYAAQAPGNADGCSALGVGVAPLLGLVARERTGVAPDMLTSMLCTTAYAVADDGIDYAGRPRRRTPDPMLYGMGALYRLYEAAEGWVFLAAPQAREWHDLCRALRAHGAADLGADERFRTAADRASNDGTLAATLAGVFRGATAAEWERRLTPLDVACVEVADGPVARAVMNDPITREAGFLVDVEHPTFGTHRRLAPIVALSATPGEARPAPTLGMHTESVLDELGYTRPRSRRWSSARSPAALPTLRHPPPRTRGPTARFARRALSDSRRGPSCRRRRCMRRLSRRPSSSTPVAPAWPSGSDRSSVRSSAAVTRSSSRAATTTRSSSAPARPERSSRPSCSSPAAGGSASW